jgi:hypothetical protein
MSGCVRHGQETEDMEEEWLPNLKEGKA